MIMNNYAWQNIQRRIKNIKNPVGAEIGVHRGDFSRRLLDNIPNLKLYMIDAWSSDTYKNLEHPEESASLNKIEIYHNWHENFKSAFSCMTEYPGHAFVMRGMSYDMSFMFDAGFFDFVWLDANHDECNVGLDILVWERTVKKGGYICGHDYGVFPGVKNAVDEIFPDAEIDSDFTWFKQI